MLNFDQAVCAEIQSCPKTGVIEWYLNGGMAHAKCLENTNLQNLFVDWKMLISGIQNKNYHRCENKTDYWECENTAGEKQQYRNC